MRAKEVALGLVRPINPYSPILIGILTVLWGMWLISPAWDTFTTAGIWDYMAELAPEWAWGSWSITSGLLVCYWTAVQNHNNQSRALGFISLHWFTVSWMLWAGDWQNTAGLTYSSICFYSVYMFLNIKINYVGKWCRLDLSRFIHHK